MRIQIAYKLLFFPKVFWLASTLVPLGSTGPSMHWRFGSPIFQKLCMKNVSCKPDYHSHQSESDWCELVVRFGRPNPTPSKHLYHSCRQNRSNGLIACLNRCMLSCVFVIWWTPRPNQSNVWMRNAMNNFGGALCDTPPCNQHIIYEDSCELEVFVVLAEVHL